MHHCPLNVHVCRGPFHLETHVGVTSVRLQMGESCKNAIVVELKPPQKDMSRIKDITHGICDCGFGKRVLANGIK